MVCSPHQPAVISIAYEGMSVIGTGTIGSGRYETQSPGIYGGGGASAGYVGQELPTTPVYSEQPTLWYEPLVVENGGNNYQTIPQTIGDVVRFAQPTEDVEVRRVGPPLFTKFVQTYNPIARGEDYSMNHEQKMKTLDGQRQDLARKVLAELGKIRAGPTVHAHKDGLVHQH